MSAAGPIEKSSQPYRVLAPIHSGNLLLFPVIRADGKSAGTGELLTLDEGLKSGAIEVTEAGKAHGLIRHRGPDDRPWSENNFRGDQVNTLVLINNSNKPLLLLAGEIVTGGKQDRVIAKDRIVPAGGDPIDLSVFCIEPGRWTESSPKFGAVAKQPAYGFMVQPAVREQAMVSKNQRQVWDAVGGAISNMAVAAAAYHADGATNGSIHGAPTSAQSRGTPLGTTSYAKAMQDSTVSSRVDEAEATVMKTRQQVLATLRQEHAIGVVVAVRGEIVWADLFADADLLSRYWTKLVRSYAAESLSAHNADNSHAAVTLADAQHFLDIPAQGAETTEGELGVYRVRELKSDGIDTFVLESLLPGLDADIHISKVKLGNEVRRVRDGIYR